MRTPTKRGGNPSATEEPNASPRKRAARSQATGNNSTALELGTASRISEIIDNTRGGRRAIQETRRSHVIDNEGYSQSQFRQVQEAINSADRADADYERDRASTDPQAPGLLEDQGHRTSTYEDRRDCCLANVKGVGFVFLMRRGDFAVSNGVLKVRNKNNKPRFVFCVGTKHVKDQATWPTSNRFWLYQYSSTTYSTLRTKLQAHSSLLGWRFVDDGTQSMDYIASDRQIYDHLKRHAAAGKIDLDAADPRMYFTSHRPISSVASWVICKDREYDGDGEEW